MYYGIEHYIQHEKRFKAVAVCVVHCSVLKS